MLCRLFCRFISEEISKYHRHKAGMCNSRTSGDRCLQSIQELEDAETRRFNYRFLSHDCWR